MNKRGLMNLCLVMMLFVVFTATMSGEQWILSHKSGKMPPGFGEKVKQAGGQVLGQIDEIGVVLADFSARENAEKLASAGFDVMPDVMLNWIPGVRTMDSAMHIGSDESYYAYQWHLPSISAPEAWNGGQTGLGARVAILDTGIWYLHPDLYGNVDFAASTSFVPGTTDFIDDHGHGTHVAGIVAAIDNNWGSIGVAPSATLIGVKVLSASGSGAISWIVQGIVHAANQDVDVINMSLGGQLKKNGYEGYYTASEAAYMINLYRKAIQYATARGSLVVMAAGNDAVDMDHNQNIIHTPAEAGNGVVVSATGPLGFAFGATDYSRVASYTNFGSSAITVAAPGGDFAAYPNSGWWYDMVFSTTVNGWSWMAGTSMATPVVSGIAALIVGKYGSLPPAQLKNRIVKTADDLGKPGADPYYGKGFVNAGRAVK